VSRLALLLLAAGWLASLPVAAEPPPPDKLDMGFYLPGIRDVPQADLRVSLQLWADEMGGRYNFVAKAVSYDDIRALHRDMSAQRTHIAIAPGMELAEQFGPDEIAEGFAGMRKAIEEGLVLVTRKGAGFSRFADLRGKRVLRLSDDRLTEIFLEVRCHREVGVACRKLFQLSEEKRDIQSIHKVFFGQADAALVRRSTLHTAIELNPQIATRLAVLIDWKVRAISFGMMSTRSDPDYRRRVIRSAEEAAGTVRGRQIIELFKTDYMGRADKADLEPYWQLLREYRELTQPDKRRGK
jgi:hypothetical protein